MKLCEGNFLERIEKIARQKPKAILLREKDLSESGYAALAEEVLKICKTYGVPCVLHSFLETAAESGADALHLPLPLLRQMEEPQKRRFQKIGTSCHSIEDALEAERLGCSYLIAGHIFATDCKKGVPPRGLLFLTEVCRAVTIPVYAIGGISADNIEAVKRAGAKGGCIMSGLMTCPDVRQFMEEFQNE